MRKSTSIVVCLSVVGIVSWSSQSHAQVCPTQSAPTVANNAATLGAYATASNAGVIYTTQLELRREASDFLAGDADTGSYGFRIAAAADIDNDGWVDIVAGRRVGQTLSVLRNVNQPVAPPDATFTQTVQGVFGGTLQDCSMALVGGDFNNDGWDDVVRIRCSNDATDTISAVDFFANDGAGQLATLPASSHATPASLGLIRRSTTSLVATDWNSDGCLDIIFGNDATSGGADGQVSVLSSDCGTPTPQFTQTVLLSGLANLDDSDGAATIAYDDLNNDGHKDIIVSSPSTLRISQWLADGVGGFGAETVISTAYGNAQGLWLVDFNLDGYPDLAWSVDDNSLTDDGKVFYWENEADGSPFDSTTPTVIHTDTSGNLDMDAGIVFDFDHDANGTIDLVVGERTGAGTGTFAAIRNQTSAENVLCGEVSSGSIDLVALGLSGTEFAVQSARLTPTELLDPGETIEYYMSNTLPETWILASDCDGGIRGPDFCANFSTPSGREIRWRAVMCRDPGDVNSTPIITATNFRFDYTPATTQFAAGVVASNGIAYAGGYQDLGDKGKFFALNGDLSGAPIWEAGVAIDAQATRFLYTTNPADETSIVNFLVDSPARTSALNAPPDPNAVVAWATSARFGGIGTPSKLGSIVNSTAAVMTPPGLPAHYSFMNDNGRAGVDAFVTANTTRDIIVFTAGKAGVIHAIKSDPNDIAATTNGEETWGFIPQPIAGNYYTDFVSATQDPTIYMDGAPTLADVWDGSKYITNLIVGGGEGSTLLTSLDVTDSFTSGPTPLWTEVISGAFGPAGNATTKPAVIRVDDSPSTDQGKFMVIAASGLSKTDTTAPFTDGRRVVGMNIDGTIQWFFDAACPITTDISAYETDDTGSFATGTIDGFTDQVVFGDFCGNVYMIDVNTVSISNPVSPPVLAPAANVKGAFDTGQVDVNTNPIIAFFSTTEADALGAGEARPIVGSISARPDTTTDLVLYFGTGGHEQVPTTDQNEFYAVYAKDRVIRSKLVGDCVGKCEKFYGGTVITETQVIFTATKDETNGTCDLGSTRVILADNAAGAGLNFANQIDVAVTAAVAAPVFAAANAIYITTIAGEIRQIGDTTAPTAGSNPTQATSTQDVAKGEYIAVSGWRQVLY